MSNIDYKKMYAITDLICSKNEKLFNYKKIDLLFILKKYKDKNIISSVIYN